MNVFCAFCVFCGSLLAQPGSAAFVGHWRLVTFENFDEKGVASDAGYDSGRITSGASRQVPNRQEPKFQTNGSERPRFCF